jgi:hypothetical protein
MRCEEEGAIQFCIACTLTGIRPALQLGFGFGLNRMLRLRVNTPYTCLALLTHESNVPRIPCVIKGIMNSVSCWSRVDSIRSRDYT